MFSVIFPGQGSQIVGMAKEFYNKYNYEPDEQSNETIEKIIGKKNIDYYTIKDFCKKYHFQVKTKKRK